MIRRIVVLAAVVWLFAVERGETQEKYTIKLKDPVQGESYVYKATESNKSVSKSEDAKGKVLAEIVETKTKSLVHTTTVLEQKAGDRIAIALSRSYDKAVTTTDGKPKMSDFEGKTVRIEKKSEKYQFRAEGGAELTAEQAKDLDLDLEFNKRKSIWSEQPLMPKQPVSVGELWTIDAAAFLEAVGSGIANKWFDFPKGKLTGKLVSVFEKNNRRFGLMEFDIDLPLKADFEVQEGQKLLGGRAVMKMTFEGCIDGGAFSRNIQATASFELRMILGAGETALTVTASSSGKVEESREDITKK